MKFHVPDMSCGHCTAAITKGIAASDPAAQVTTDLTTRMVTIDSTLDGAQMQAVLKAAGYDATPAV